MQLSLTFAGAEDAAGAEDGPLAALRAKLLAARAKVDDKRVIFDRLGKARAVIGAIQRVGEAVSDVRAPLLVAVLLTEAPCVFRFILRSRARCRALTS